MRSEMLNKLLLLPALLLAGLIFYVGCTSDGAQFRGGLGSGEEYYGPSTLEERIAKADAIVRARLLSVTAVAEQQAVDPGYIAALDHRFRVLEYLRGSGAAEIVAVAYDPGENFSSRGSAVERANILKDRRDTRWDDREAIIFLEKHPDLPSTQQADRYRLGGLSYYYEDEDYFTIASPWGKRWLPAASTGGASETRGASGAGGGTQFLLDVPAAPTGGASGASGASGQSASSAPTVTLAGLKAMVADNDREIAAGGGSAEYKNCLYLKLEWERRVNYLKAASDGKYYYLRHDADIGSGQPAGTRAFTDPYGGEGETPPPKLGDIYAIYQDAALFTTNWPGVADTVRPLPAGEYRFYYGYRPKEYVICDGLPEDEKKRREVFVTVTAPVGTVHEAFFDPVAIGSAVGADASNGALNPTSFTVGGARASLQSLKWEGVSVTLTLSSSVPLSGHTIDFIALDGTVARSLNGGAATVSGNNLTWNVATQPWQAGDKLMLRISQTGAPVFGQGSYAFSIGEHAELAAAVGTVSATDQQGDSITYSITAGNGDGKFAIGSATGAITVAGALDYEDTASYTLTVQATDGTGEDANKTTVQAAITVEDENDAPVFGEESYAFTVGEDAELAAAVGTVSATDADDDTLAYAITAGNGDGKFAIGSATGAITVAGSLDHETTASYTLTVEASDGTGTDAKKTTVQVVITVTDAPDPTPTPTPAPTPTPTPTPTNAFSVAEDAAVGAAVGTVSATGLQGDSITYAITAGNGDGKFAIGSATGAITVAGSLDYETTASYTLTVEARDGTGEDANKTTVQVAITVTNANDAPVFSEESYSFSIAENAGSYTPVGAPLAASDQDGDALSYHITGGNGDRKFSIDLNVGDILLVRGLDYETKSSYTLTVEVRDGKGGKDTATAEITVTDVAE